MGRAADKVLPSSAGSPRAGPSVAWGKRHWIGPAPSRRRSGHPTLARKVSRRPGVSQLSTPFVTLCTVQRNFLLRAESRADPGCIGQRCSCQACHGYLRSWASYLQHGLQSLISFRVRDSYISRASAYILFSLFSWMCPFLPAALVLACSQLPSSLRGGWPVAERPVPRVARNGYFRRSGPSLVPLGGARVDTSPTGKVVGSWSSAAGFWI